MCADVCMFMCVHMHLCTQDSLRGHSEMLFTCPSPPALDTVSLTEPSALSSRLDS